MNKSDRNYETFKRTFALWQKRFGLSDYRVDFEACELQDVYADIHSDHVESVARVRFNNKVSNDARPHEDVRRSAKHEAIHLLIGKLEELGRQRYVRSEELYAEAEHLARKLEQLIPDVGKS